MALTTTMKIILAAAVVAVASVNNAAAVRPYADLYVDDMSSSSSLAVRVRWRPYARKIKTPPIPRSC